MAIQPMNDNDDIQDAGPIDESEAEQGGDNETPLLPREISLKRNFEIFTLWERDKGKPRYGDRWTEKALAERYQVNIPRIHQIVYEMRRHVDWQGNIPHANLFADKVDENAPPTLADRRQYRLRDRKTWDRWVNRWLGVYAQTGNKTIACKRARVAPETVRAREKSDPAFARKVREAFETSVELKEAEVDRRGFDGFVVKTHYYKGKPVGKETGFSDLLAMFRLKMLKPEYRDNHNQKIQVDVNVRNEIDGAKRLLADPEARRQALELARKLALEPPKVLVEPAAPVDPSQVVEENDDQIGDDSGA